MIGFGLGLAAATAMMVVIWIASLVRRDASIVDIFWGPGFVLLAWIYRLDAGTSAGIRGDVVVALVTLWGLRLAGHILVRNRGQGEDFRYRAMRQTHGRSFAWVSLFKVFLLQAFILWCVSAPLYQAQRSAGSRELGWLDAAGIVLFSIGFLFEAVGDWQLSRFKADPSNRGKVLDRGLWRYTRHPNYFGDAVVWWALFLMALGAPGGWWTFFGPVLMTFLLMRVSGVALLEKTLAETKPAYRDYVRRTSPFFPWPPR